MSNQLLEALNGQARGAFFRCLEHYRINGAPRIAWYPSAGDDFRDLIYLSAQFAERNPGTVPDPPPPTLFIHTDVRLPTSFDAWGTEPVHRSSHTRITVLERERLPNVSLPASPSLAFDPPHERGRVEFFELEVNSDVHGPMRARLLYVQAENAAFCAKYLLAHRARITHIVQVRYGHGEGGARTSGAWLECFTEALGTEVLVADRFLRPGHGDAHPQERCFPELAEHRALTTVTRAIKTMRGERWSHHGDVTWWVRGEASPPRRPSHRVAIPADLEGRLRDFSQKHAVDEDALVALLIRRALDADLLPGSAELDAMRGVLLLP